MNLSFLKDHELHLATQKLVQKERELLTTILHHLAEIEKRRLYCDHLCSSLFEYCVKIIGYSESQAQRRISAMRLIREIPEVEKKIESGSLTLTNLSEAQRFFRQEQKLSHKNFTLDEKKQVLSQLENKSSREGERELLAMSSQPILFQEKTRAVTPNITELKILVGVKINSSVSDKEQIKTNVGQIILNRKTRKAIPISVKRIVWHRDQGRCCNCGSRHRLEYDHIIPVAFAGENDPSNLRLLCSHCNERAAIHQFGVNKMSHYLKPQGL